MSAATEVQWLGQHRSGVILPSSVTVGFTSSSGFSTVPTEAERGVGRLEVLSHVTCNIKGQHDTYNNPLYNTIESFAVEPDHARPTDGYGSHDDVRHLLVHRLDD
ncbi:hypothetical protein EVAR_12899_1 [Eumeta japonica]|uniref:Uncharacterized protein n=1 Tax=Eumeta variegata TaxID=151549 RepID=A0A4C1TW26_EUMVA|nr:hypothetical protein EVAR_12899_1 [Eumeta japonica]